MSPECSSESDLSAEVVGSFVEQVNNEPLETVIARVTVEKMRTCTWDARRKQAVLLDRIEWYRDLERQFFEIAKKFLNGRQEEEITIVFSGYMGTNGEASQKEKMAAMQNEETRKSKQEAQDSGEVVARNGEISEHKQSIWDGETAEMRMKRELFHILSRMYEFRHNEASAEEMRELFTNPETSQKYELHTEIIRKTKDWTYVIQSIKLISKVENDRGDALQESPQSP